MDDGHPIRQPWTVRLAAWSARHRWPVLALWLVATIGIFVVSNLVGGVRTLDVNEDPSERRLESQEAYEVFGTGRPEAPSERVVFVIGGGPAAATDPAFQAGVTKLAADLAAAH